jgi:16S rRNA (cytidine1402-2'-O)-methyltransferase
MAKLSIVATPIGNLEDITLRALRTLKECDVILCEDTRVTGKLLQKFEIKKPTLSYNAHSTEAKNDKVFTLLIEGKHIVLVSDAGTPSISDPGSYLVGRVREHFGSEVTVEVIPGPSAVIAALSGAGIPVSDFLFLGFLPHKKGRETLFKEIASSKRAVVFYESPHRIVKALESLQKVDPTRKIIIARELTKMYEEFLFGTAVELLKKKEWRGEIVVIVAPEK